MAGLDLSEQTVASDDPSARAELLLLSPSFLVPCLTHDGVKIWDTLAIGEYLNETLPEAGLLPTHKAARAHCRSICGEMHSGFTNMRSALPMNMKAHHPGFKVWAGARGRYRPHPEHLARMPSEHQRPVLVRQAAPWPDAMFAPV